VCGSSNGALTAHVSQVSDASTIRRYDDLVKLPFVVAAIGSLLLFANVARADRIKVAVVPGIAVNLDSARVDALSQDLADALATELDIDAVGGLEVRRQLPAEGLPADCLTTPACVADVAKRTSANQLLFVVMVDAGGTGAVQVDSTWVEAATGRSTSRPAIDVPTIGEAKPRFIAAAHLLLPDAPVRPKAKPRGGGIDGKMSDTIPRHLTMPAYFTGGAALVGLGVGVGFGFKARSSYNDCDKSGLCDQSTKDSIRTKALIADSGFLIATAGIIATGIIYATSGSESHLIVTPTEGGASLAAFGRF
jgi:hypothetical protein